MLKQFIVSIAVMGSAPLFANIQVCNNRDHLVFTSVAYTSVFEKDSKTFTQNETAGWWGIQPGSCAEVSRLDGKKLFGGKIYLRSEVNLMPEMNNAKYLVCYHPTDRFEFFKVKELSSSDEASLSALSCDADSCKHPLLGECSEFDKAYGGEGAMTSAFEEKMVTETDATINLD